MKTSLGVFFILIAVQFICIINVLNYHYGLGLSYIPSILLIVLGILQILIPFIKYIKKNKEI